MREGCWRSAERTIKQRLVGVPAAVTMQVEREFHHARTQHGEDGFDRVLGPDGAHLLERLQLQHLREDLQRKVRELVAYLHSCRTRWAWAWIHDRFSAGMQASQRA